MVKVERLRHICTPFVADLIMSHVKVYCLCTYNFHMFQSVCRGSIKFPASFIKLICCVFIQLQKVLILVLCYKLKFKTLSHT